MTAEQWRKLVEMAVEVRRLQKEYFRDRDRALLDKCRKAERAFDKAAAEALAGGGLDL